MVNDDVRSEFQMTVNIWHFMELSHKCNVFLSLILSLCFSDTLMPVSIIKLYKGTYIF